ncbi:MAG: Trk system potassium transporter TrkA [Alphaproteobacteria bacterium]|nr:Trk system potassium transporter TrkA [Alphaproteobacteria bacterium]
MKIIVGGAGNVGKSIVGYLTQGNNDIIVIDTDSSKLEELSKEFDLQTIVGSVSNPDILEKAAAKTADMIIAATNVDEVNMVACQVAYSLFNIEKRIARIDSQGFLDPEYITLYNENNIPVDLIISPDIAIANAIIEILKIPGTSQVLPLAGRKLFLISFRCPEKCPLIKTPLVHLERIAPELDVAFVSIVRNGKHFLPTGEDEILPEDMLYLLVSEDKIDGMIHDFGMEHNANEKIIIFGDNDITYYIAQSLENNDNILSCKVIDNDDSSARKLADKLNDTIVLYGEMMSDTLLTEAGIENTDATIAITRRDKDNLLASLLAKKNGVASTITLVNSRSYDNLIDNIGDNIIIDRSTVTISSILQELRKAKISNAYSLGRGFGEIWEIKIDEESRNINKNVAELDLPSSSKICALVRGNEILYDLEEIRFAAGDVLILFVTSKYIKGAEKLFS